MRINLLLKNLDSARNYKVYSRTNTNFEKVFGNFTLKSFIKSLKNPRKIKKKNFLEEMAEKYPNDQDPYYPGTEMISKRKEKLKELLDKLNDEYIQNYSSIEKPKKPNFSLNSRKPIKIDLTPNPCTYTPKYDLVFKSVPFTKIFDTPKNISYFNKTEGIKNITNEKNGTNSSRYKNYHKRKKLKLASLKLFNKKIKFLTRNDILKTERNKKFLKIENKEKNFKSAYKKENKENNEEKNKSNEIIKIIENNKINKTPSIKKKKINYNCILKTNTSSESSYNDKKGNNIDFKKMSDRNFNIILNKSALKYPSFYSYEPKFDYITQSTKAFHFGLKNNKTNLQKKKLLLKKIWCSYSNLSKDYYLINNSKLKENI